MAKYIKLLNLCTQKLLLMIYNQKPFFSDDIWTRGGEESRVLMAVAGLAARMAVRPPDGGKAVLADSGRTGFIPWIVGYQDMALL